jgi:hypothetical protein
MSTVLGGASAGEPVAVHGTGRRPILELIRRGGALDGVRILSPHTVGLMHTNQVRTLLSPNGPGFGLGFENGPLWLQRHGLGRLVQVGRCGMGRCHASIQMRVVLLLMPQLLPSTTDMREKFPALVYQALLDTPSSLDRGWSGGL